MRLTKQINVRRDGHQSRFLRHRRRGAMFHYYMVYLLMTGSVMASAGVCMHTLFQSGYRDEVVRNQIQTIERMERLLRVDAADATDVRSTDANQLSCSISNGEFANPLIQWTANGRDLLRVVSNENAIVQRERFRFIVGTELSILSTDDGRIVVRISEPMVASRAAERVAEAEKNPPTSTRSPNQRRFETDIVLFSKTADADAGEAAAANSQESGAESDGGKL